MTGDSPHSPTNHLATQVEGYLLLQAEQERARSEAVALCARLPWLTTAQAEDLTRHYTTQRLDLTQQMLQTMVQRAGQLRREYEARYLALRRTLLKRQAAATAAILVCASAAITGAYLLSR
ncbi:hypothetical protein ABTX71_07890 [Streptomyces parvulus]|uniref:hypothetical protein n=1 Tax=Streptomyces parvulus TaxID=146923 RepID=UPI0033246750